MSHGAPLRRIVPGLVLAALARLAGAQPAPAPPAASGTPRRVTVVAGPRYRAGALHRWLLGPTYRETWTTPVEVEVLDLGTFAGGLTPTGTGGGRQTKGLTFRSADERRFKFRSIDKDPSPILPPALRGTFADWIVRDQISAAYPASPLVVDALSEAVGVWHAPHWMVVLPDDPRLGKFQKEFAGMLGMLEEPPRKGGPGLDGIDELADTEDFMALLDDGPDNRLDTRAYLRARLFDIFIGDWDRHSGQWEWGRRAGTSLWEPLPKDRDQAFARFDGLILAITRINQPRLIEFGNHYPNLTGLNWNAWELDRRLLTDLERPVWDEVAAEMQGRLTDTVIDRAIRALPAPYARVSGAVLAQRLKRRRDGLREVARDFYRLLSQPVTVYGTHQAEEVEVTRGEGGEVEVRMSMAGQPEPYYRRRFEPRDTREVALYLQGGDDRVQVRGPGNEIRLRVVGGDGNDVLDDTQGGGTRLYDSSGQNRLLKGPGSHIIEEPYVQPTDGAANLLAEWGHTRALLPYLVAGGDLGVLLGLQFRVDSHGFRKPDYATRHAVRAGYATVGGGRADYELEHRHVDPGKRERLFAYASDVEVIRFHGFGNETPAPGQGSFYRAPQRQFRIEPSFQVPLGPLSLTTGVVAQYAVTHPAPGSFLDLTRPYGTGEFGQAGARLRLTFDRRDVPQAPSRGVRLWAQGTAWPQVWSVRQAFGEVHGEAATYLGAPLPLLPVLALRAGGRRVWGPYPFHEAAFLGGPDSLRGLRRQRYAGDAVVYGSTELRLTLGRVKLLAPVDLGLFGLADVGRVFLAGESSRRWHHGEGGGLWVAIHRPENTLSLAVARSEGQVRVYFQTGLAF